MCLESLLTNAMNTVVLRISVDKCNEYGLTLELAGSRRFPTKKITDADYADDLIHIMHKNYCIF